MILKNLEIESFGPFKNKEVIDFEKLSDNKIFLIYGKTGSGKSTIFDAISYVLFNEMTGNYRKSNSIKSMYSSKESICRVKLTFVEKGITYIVERTPKQKIYSSRKKEMVEKNATATLYSLSSDGELKSITNKSNEVTSKVIEIIGINHEQFTQVVVLPQGQFIDILNKKGIERENLLNALLKTDKYNNLTNRIKEERDNSYYKISNVDNSINTLLKQSEVNTKLELEEKIKLIESEYFNLDSEYQKISNQVLLLTKEIEKDINHNNILNAYFSENEKLDLLKQKDKYILLLKDNMHKIHKVENIMPFFLKYENIKKQVNDSKSQIKQIQEELLQHKKEFESLNELNLLLTSYKEEINKETIKFNKFNSLKSTYDSISSLRSEINTYRITKERLFSLLTRDEEILLISQKDIDNLLNEIDDYNSKINQEESLKLKLEKLNNIKNNINQFKIEENRYLENSKRLAILKSKNEEEKSKLESLKNSYKVQEEIYTHNELFKYKEQLKDNQPCPLCGSRNHPNIIKLLNEVVTKEVLDTLKEQIDHLNDKIISTNSYIINEEGNLKILEELLEKSEVASLNLNDINKEIAEIIDDLEKIEDYKKRLKKAEISLNNKKNENKKLNDDLTENKKEHSRISGLIEAKTNVLNDSLNKILSISESVELFIEELENLSQHISEINNKILSLDNQINKINSLKTSLETKLTTIQDNLDKYIKEENNSSSLLNNSLKENEINIDDFNEIKTTLLINKQEYEKNIETYSRDVNTSLSLIENYKKQLKFFEFIEIEEKNNKLAILNSDSKNIQDNLINVKGKFNLLTTNLNSIKNYEKSIENELKRFNILERLNLLASGKIVGVSKMSLSKFVLSKLLDDMILYANKYYDKFSLGRYKLTRNDSVDSSSSGLDLDVIDGLTSSTRPVSSLSGGESFMAALALSLGMSECISSLIGGININMVFIDEGFGTLDDEYLDQALETLNKLSSSGLMIGLISHIDELKNRISSKIEVVKTSYGSYIKY